MNDDIKGKRIDSGHLFIYFFLFLWMGVSLIFFGWIFITSFKTNRELFQYPWSLPQSWNIKNYIRAWTAGHIGEFFINSIYVTTISVFFIVLISALASYALARMRFSANKWIYLLFVAGLAIPFQLVVVPLYLMLNHMRLTDMLNGLAMVYISLSLPFTIFFLTGFMKSIPLELEEAAIIDGCSELGVFWKVTLPLSSPGLITVTILNLFGIWNEFLLALILISKTEKSTIPLGLSKLQAMQTYAADWTTLFAGLVISMIPTLTLFIFMQKKIVSGLTAGALKG